MITHDLNVKQCLFLIVRHASKVSSTAQNNMFTIITPKYAATYIECKNQHSKLETYEGSFEPSTLVYVLAT